MRVGDVFGTAGVLHHPQESSPQLLETLKMVTPQHEKSIFFVPKSSLFLTVFTIFSAHARLKLNLI